MNLVRAAPLKHDVPPKTSNDPTKSFSLTAATPIALDEDIHESGLCLRVKLRNPHPGRPFRTGELIEGDVHIFGRPKIPGAIPDPSSSLAISRLSLRIYFESRTTFWQLCPTGPDRQTKPSFIQRFEKILRHEVHRGVVPLNTAWPINQDITIPLKGTLLGRSHATLGFSFTLPRTMVITETNNCDDAPRGLCSFERCPPPSFRQPGGSVEWVIEAIMILAGHESPRTDERMLHVSTKNVLVSRLVFPVLPAGLDVGPLRDEPFFGDDLGADLIGARSRTIQPDSALSERLGLQLFSPNKTWECYAKVLNLSYGCVIEAELYVPFGAMVSQNTATFDTCLVLRPLGSTYRNQRFGMFRKNKLVIVRCARFTLHRFVSTRGGKENKPHLSSVLVREYDLGLDRRILVNLPNGALSPNCSKVDLVHITLPFDLQTDGTQTKDIARPMVPLSNLVPSFRTPNIQLEYIFALSLFFVDDTHEYHVARFPLQITPEGTVSINGYGDFPDSKLSLQ